MLCQSQYQHTLLGPSQPEQVPTQQVACHFETHCTAPSIKCTLRMPATLEHRVSITRTAPCPPWRLRAPAGLQTPSPAYRLHPLLTAVPGELPWRPCMMGMWPTVLALG